MKTLSHLYHRARRLPSGKKRGFTIVETLVAFIIIALVTMGVTRGIQSVLSSYIFSKDQITAFYLAQEGIEEVRNIRDENALNSRHWLYGLAQTSSDACYFGNSCMVSLLEFSRVARCTTLGGCPTLRQDPDNGFYGYNGAWTATPFTRDITLTSISANEVQVTVTVSWTKGGAARQFRAQENLLNWQ
jgi:Tfp pilus assembly protein PilV